MKRHFLYVKKYAQNPPVDRIREAEKNGSIEKWKMEFWENLDGFLKDSNIAVSDHYTIFSVRSDLGKRGLECRAKLEYIRWCWFYYLCGWKYGEPKNRNERKNTVLRIHHALLPWDWLDKEYREKSQDQVRMELDRNK